MAEYPLLSLPRPNAVTPPKPGRPPIPPRFPGRAHQIARLGPTFDRLAEALSRSNGSAELHSDPSSLAPDRVIVFEIAGDIQGFARAASRVSGLELMGELEAEIEPGEDFAAIDTRAGRQGQDRLDIPVKGHVYLTMPDMSALRQVVSLWRAWQRGDSLPSGFAPFGRLFAQLSDVRPWGPQDRIPDETIQYWQEKVALHPNLPVRTEIEFWFHSSQVRRNAASAELISIVDSMGGRVVDEATILPIAYHGALVDIPQSEIAGLADRRSVRLALANEVMFLRPQSSLSSDPFLISQDSSTDLRDYMTSEPIDDPPIAAIFDGVPVAAHALLRDRLLLDDADDLQSIADVSQRFHATGMASLILHGDRNASGNAIKRRVYMRPIMHSTPGGGETTDTDRLVVDTLHRAVHSMKEGIGGNAVAPTVFLVNLSVGDPNRAFANSVSPMARLLDYLSERYGILFLVSSGNHQGPFFIHRFQDWSEFSNASREDQERAVLEALDQIKHERTLLSPAESINSLTVGASHQDAIETRLHSWDVFDPFVDSTFPNPSSAIGLGFGRSIKPELVLPGGREHLRYLGNPHGIKVAPDKPNKTFGMRVASPDPVGTGRLNLETLSAGTSVATALATRAGHQIFDALMDGEGGSRFAEMDPAYYPVVVKALLVHGASWSSNASTLVEVCGPAGSHRSAARSENTCRLLGYGVPDVSSCCECAFNRATLVGYGQLLPDHAQSHRIPLPPCLERVTLPRSLRLTLAWISPVNPRHQRYRGAKLGIKSKHAIDEAFGVSRQGVNQPHSSLVKRGTVHQEILSGRQAVAYVVDDHLELHVWCKEDAGRVSKAIRYGIAVTIESEVDLPIYDEIRASLQVRARS